MSDGIRPKFRERPPEMRPRERLIADSAKSLNNAELLAILLQTGNGERDVLTLAEDILITSGGLEGLLRQNLHSLCEIKGIGPGKACMLLAAIELGCRFSHLQAGQAQRQVRDSESAAWYLRGNIHNSEQESFHVLYLDAKNNILEVRELFVGTVNGASVHPRDIFREAVRLNAVSLIIGHNHPSGDLTPSRDDLLLTRRVREASALMGINFLDHIIVAGAQDSRYLSFQDAGYLE